WRALMSTFGICPGPITANDFYSRMLAQPLRQRLSCAIRQQINWPVCFQINDYGAVGVAFPKREVIHADEARRDGRCLCAALHQAQQRILTGWQGQIHTQLSASIPSKGKADTALSCSQTSGTAGIGSDKGRQAFGENDALAIWRGTKGFTKM